MGVRGTNTPKTQPRMTAHACVPLLRLYGFTSVATACAGVTHCCTDECQVNRGQSMFHEVSTNLFRDEGNSEKIHRPHNLFMAVLSISFAVHSSKRTTIAISGSMQYLLHSCYPAPFLRILFTWSSPVRCPRNRDSCCGTFLTWC